MRTKFLRTSLILFLLAVNLLPAAAQNYGNEWIRKDQKYVKFKIWKQGIYKMDFFVLDQAFRELGTTLLVVDPRNIQMFRDGKQIPVFVQGEEDGQFGFGDWVEFYGEPSDGTLDRELYEKPEDQPHDFKSFVHDTAYYYLTFTASEKGLRYSRIAGLSAASLTPEPWYYHENRQVLAEEYNSGVCYPVADKDFYFSEYNRGEGWTGKWWGRSYTWQGAVQWQYSVPSDNYEGAGILPRAELRVFGASDFRNLSGNDHQLELGFSPDGIAYNKYFDTTFEAYGDVKKQFTLTTSDIGSSRTYFHFSANALPGIGASGYRVSYIRLWYPRKFNLLDSTRFSFALARSAGKRMIEWDRYGTGSKKKPILFDHQNRLRVTGDLLAGNKARFVIPGTADSGNCFIQDSLDFVWLKYAEPVVMTDWSQLFNKAQYLVLIHKKFDGPEIDAYVNYRKGRYTVQKILTRDIYESFSYGMEHPIAIRRFCKLMLDSSLLTPPEYLFLVGRGYQTNLLRARPEYATKNYMPSIGVPASDALFTSGLHGTKLEPALATGRLTIDFKSDISSYLDKVKLYENGDYAPWRKQVLHLAGGESATETRVIKNCLAAVEQLVEEKTPYAGNVTTFSRSANTLNDPALKQKCVNAINNGVNMVTFLGHGSSTVLDIDIGDTADYYNLSKYPICYFNGCQIGNPCIGLDDKNRLYFGEKLIRSSGKGGVAFIGQTFYSELFTLTSQIGAFYNTMFYSSPGNTLGKVYQECISNYQNLASNLNRSSCRQLMLQGDPGLTIYAPDKPDYAVDKTSLFIAPENATALSDSFRLGVIIENRGKYVHDTVLVEVRRVLPDGVTNYFETIKAVNIGFRDTFYVTYRTKDPLTKGINTFSVRVNPGRTTVESEYSNNDVLNWERYIPGNGINLIYPRRFGIVAKDTVTLVAQNADLFRLNEQFIFEIDTVPGFNSPWKKASPFKNASGVVQHQFKLLNKDSQVYYWRGRVNLPVAEGGQWVERSFTYIQNHGPGWSQRHFPQFYPKSNNRGTIEFDTLNRRMEFSKIGLKLFLDAEYSTTTRKGVKLGGYDAQDWNYGSDCIYGGFIVMLFDKNRLERYLLPLNQIESQCIWGKKWPPYQAYKYQAYYGFDMSSPTDQDEFIRFVNLIPDSTHVALFSSRFSHADKWKPEIRQALNKIGSSIMDTVLNPKSIFVMLGKKGAKPGTAIEDKAVYNGEPGSGYANTEGTIVGRLASGYVESEAIGPVSRWGAAFFNWKKSDAQSFRDRVVYDVIARNRNGIDSEAVVGFSGGQLDLSFLNANWYPYIRLRARMFDDTFYSSPTLTSWRVTFDEVPEGTLVPMASRGYRFYNDSLYQGDTLRLDIPFENISTKDFRDSVKLFYRISHKQTRNLVEEQTLKVGPLPVGKTFMYSKQLPTKDLSGNYLFYYSVNPQYDQQELTLVNNANTFNFNVYKDKVNPVLDVTFDGRHITDGEIVSANPMITISSKDENKYLLQKDTSGFRMLLRYPNTTDFRWVKLDGTEAVFFPAQSAENRARVEFRPQSLPDGNYVLRVQSKDVAGNVAGMYDYEISFNVVNRSTVTHFYPYPNPFSTSMKFVFTLTGSEVPEDIRIKIMTLTGKVVREVSKAELGNVHIGNNISDFAWDGTDQFGDRLANGVYLYKVTVKQDGKEVELRESAGDDAFTENVGKIYLLR